MTPPADRRIWGAETSELQLVARNVSTRYAAIALEGVIGLLLLPFNVEHLGKSAYGLWALVASITIYFSVLDLGYGGALVKFVAQYRAWRDRDALNEVLSTLFVIFSGVGLVALGATGVLAWQFPRLFNVSPEQVATGRSLLLIIGTYIAVRFSVSVFGAVVYGFQRYYLNNVVSMTTTLTVAAVNVLMLQAGYGLVHLVAATTAVRVLALGVFALVAFRVFPGLHVRPRLYRSARLKEVSGFSVYMLVLDWSSKLNYSADALVIGATLGTATVAVWTVAQRLAEVSQHLTNQLNDALFPFVVDSHAARRAERLRLVLIQGTRLSLALAVPVSLGLAMVASPLVTAWVGPTFAGSVIVAQVLLTVVMVRVGNASANLILKGAGQHRLLAFTNLTTAIVNVLASIVVIRPFGIAGVAVATLVPVAAAAAFVLFPAACRRVGLPVWQVVRQAIWPALWPAVALAIVVRIGLPWTGGTLAGLGILLVVAGAVYQALFFGVAVGAGERRFYVSKLRQLWNRRPGVPAAA